MGGFDHRLCHLQADTLMSTDILYPLLIGAGCVLIVVAVHLLTRARPSRSDIRLPGTTVAASAGPTVTQLDEWHRVHEGSVLSFLDLHDPSPDSTPEPEMTLIGLESAIDAHPAPDMAAELAALRTAAEAMSAAREREDTDAFERHREVYRTYRDAWLERLWQFPVDSERVDDTRRRDLAEN